MKSIHLFREAQENRTEKEWKIHRGNGKKQRFLRHFHSFQSPDASVSSISCASLAQSTMCMHSYEISLHYSDRPTREMHHKKQIHFHLSSLRFLHSKVKARTSYLHTSMDIASLLKIHFWSTISTSTKCKLQLHFLSATASDSFARVRLGQILANIIKIVTVEIKFNFDYSRCLCLCCFWHAKISKDFFLFASHSPSSRP